ncbi:GNAT family N-acetyltransferase [Rossellomorea vietnamensis]|uniref:GNAT family N-acetyltransferase n=1 Tax=Rossellomorea vietnamensis TaxID=218284 RepID=A0A5D4MD16_9BACI|nr:GNAT family N-acetyltransferase [Rossellomorea vietnamensis]TYR99337.1 GNAT family N-acetyltransferase [Rossellomorea vietnamensis]
MIRNYLPFDSNEINELFAAIDTGYEIDSAEGIEKNAGKFILYEEDGIKGAAYAALSVNEVGEKQADLKIYVEPSSRKRGIGTELFHELSAYAEKEKQEVLIASFRTDKMNPAGFCVKNGMEKWWGSPSLVYKGPLFPDPQTHFELYEERLFQQFFNMVQECYYPLHKEIDLKPYLASSESVRAYQLRDPKNVYVAMDGEEIMASVTIGKGEVDNLMVSPRFQKRGLGRDALHFAMNRLLNSGYEEIRICYMENNKAAERLYYSAGFIMAENMNVYRKYIV